METPWSHHTGKETNKESESIHGLFPHQTCMRPLTTKLFSHLLLVFLIGIEIIANSIALTPVLGQLAAR